MPQAASAKHRVADWGSALPAAPWAASEMRRARAQQERVQILLVLQPAAPQALAGQKAAVRQAWCRLQSAHPMARAKPMDHRRRSSPLRRSQGALRRRRALRWKITSCCSAWGPWSCVEGGSRNAGHSFSRARGHCTHAHALARSWFSPFSDNAVRFRTDSRQMALGPCRRRHALAPAYFGRGISTGCRSWIDFTESEVSRATAQIAFP
jgi:hypothetical protein